MLPLPLGENTGLWFQLQSPLSLYLWGESRPKTSSSSTHWPFLWVYSASSKAQEKPLWSTSLELSPTCTQTQPLDSLLPHPYAAFRSHMKLYTDSFSISATQLGLQFATQHFQVSIAHRSGLTELSSMQLCIWTWLSWSTHHHWAINMWK